MNNLRKRVMILFLLIPALAVFMSCSSEGENETTTVRAAGDMVAYTAGSVTFNMVYVPGGKTYMAGINDDGDKNNDGDTIDPEDEPGGTTVTGAYEIGKTEVTYELWKEVYDWAVSSSYTFANKGREGNDGTIGGAVVGTEPVTTVNWRDAMVWMNALTEYYNAQNGTSFEPVYTYLSAIIRDSQDINDTACDNAVVSASADGFRLLSKDEYELAARYISDDGDNTLESGEYYPGNYASGATADYNDPAATGLVAVYIASSTAVVKSKNENTLGLYDMSGNVWEWVFDLSVIGPYRAIRGGSWGDRPD